LIEMCCVDTGHLYVTWSFHCWAVWDLSSRCCFYSFCSSSSSLCSECSSSAESQFRASSSVYFTPLCSRREVKSKFQCFDFL